MNLTAPRGGYTVLNPAERVGLGCRSLSACAGQWLQPASVAANWSGRPGAPLSLVAACSQHDSKHSAGVVGGCGRSYSRSRSRSYRRCAAEVHNAISQDVFADARQRWRRHRLSVGSSTCSKQDEKPRSVWCWRNQSVPASDRPLPTAAAGHTAGRGRAAPAATAAAAPAHQPPGAALWSDLAPSCRPDLHPDSTAPQSLSGRLSSCWPDGALLRPRKGGGTSLAMLRTLICTPGAFVARAQGSGLRLVQEPQPSQPQPLPRQPLPQPGSQQVQVALGVARRRPQRLPQRLPGQERLGFSSPAVATDSGERQGLQQQRAQPAGTAAVLPRMPAAPAAFLRASPGALPLWPTLRLLHRVLRVQTGVAYCMCTGGHCCR
jgi:hypothetical protein